METSARYSLVGAFSLAVILIALAFVYWLHNTGGFGTKHTFRVVFERTAGGLLVGSPVQFNGIKVGEVSALSLSPRDPRRVEAVIAVDAAVPVRVDTAVTIEAQGLTGSPVLALAGGDPAAAELPPASPLVAPRSAGTSINQSAREVLARIDGILSDNAEPLHRLITDLQTFSGALSRNAERVDGILAGIERMTGGSAKGPNAIVDINAPAMEAAASPPAGMMVIPEPTAALALNSDKVMQRDVNGAMIPASGVQWSDAVPALVQSRLIQTFENAGAGSFVVRQSDSAPSAPRLLVEIRSFAVDGQPTPHGVVELSARILSATGVVTAVKAARGDVPVAGTDAVAAARALDFAFQSCARELVEWAIASAAARPRATPGKTDKR